MIIFLIESEKMEKKLLLQIQSSFTLLYNSLKQFLYQNFQELKILSKNQQEFISLSNKVTNTFISDFETKKELINNNYEKFKEAQEKEIIKIINNSKELEKEVDNSPYLIKRPHLLKYILEIPLQINVFNSYMNIIENDIKAFSYRNIELLNTMILISNTTLDVTIK